MGDDTAADTPANDSSLFRDAVGEVKPVSNNRRIPDTPKVTPKANYQAIDEREVMDQLLDDFSADDVLETGDHLAWTPRSARPDPRAG